MPPHFSSIYTPISDAGTTNQIRHVARLMAAQMTNAGVGPGVDQVGYIPKKVERQDQIIFATDSCNISFIGHQL